MTRVIVSVGTDHHPFHRMLRWCDLAGRELSLDLMIQRGATPPRPGLESVDYLEGLELADQMRKADAVVCHGGPGTISLARRCGHRPIVIARDPALGEHIDDHQMRYTNKLESEGAIDQAHDVDELVALLREPRPRPLPSDAMMSAEAVERFGELVERLLDGSLPKRRWRDRVLWGRS